MSENLRAPCPHWGETLTARLKLPAVKPRTARTVQRVLEDSELVFEAGQEETGMGSLVALDRARVDEPTSPVSSRVWSFDHSRIVLRSPPTSDGLGLVLAPMGQLLPFSRLESTKSRAAT
jgi:hypothetical protein